MDREVFIAETAAKILASMYSNTEKDPDVKYSVNSAIKLWDELVSRKVITSSDEED